MKSRLSELRGVESATLFKVLSSDTRRDILRMLQRGPMAVGAVADGLGLSRSSVTRHIQDLAAAGLVTSESVDGGQGAQKVCRLRYERVVVSFEGAPPPRERTVETEMPLGLYSRVEASPPCGLASATAIIGSYDDPQSFLLPERASAQLVWIGRGYLDYLFPNPLPADAVVTRMELAMEICSEIALHRIDYPSDVTLWINGHEIGTWTSYGGLGHNRGRLTPAWWWDTRTQYGMLKVWSVDHEGAYVDGSPVSSFTLDQMGLTPSTPLAIRIGIKEDARNWGGFNLFGRRFGNYEQDLVLRLHYFEGSPQED